MKQVALDRETQIERLTADYAQVVSDLAAVRTRVESKTNVISRSVSHTSLDVRSGVLLH